MTHTINLPQQPPRQLGPRQKAWIAEFIKPAHDGAERVAAADESARRSREMAIAIAEARPRRSKRFRIFR